MNAQARPIQHAASDRLEDSSTLAKFEERLAGVRSLFDSLSTNLQHALVEMRGRGLPPNHSLVFEIGECHRAFIRLRADILRNAAEHRIEAPPLDRLADLHDLSRLLDHLRPTQPIHAPRHEEPAEVKVEPRSEPIEKPFVPEAPLKIEPVRAPIEKPVAEEAPAKIEPVREPISKPLVFESPGFAAAGQPNVIAPIDHRVIPIPTYQAPQPAPHIVTHEPILEPVPIPVPDEPEPHDAVVQAVPEEPTPVVVAETTSADSPEAIRTSALQCLKQVLALKPRDQGEFAPLTACQEKARALAETIARADPNDLPPEARELALGEHPFASLLIVVAGVGDLGDAQWANHHSQISETFGRPMAVAAARGRLHRDD